MLESTKPVSRKPSKPYAMLEKAYMRFLKIRGEPREIALGFALGLFVGMTPVMGFQTVIAVFFATMFKWNKISAALAVWITNPVTAPVIYGLTFLLGAKVIGLEKAQAISGKLFSEAFLDLVKKAPEIVIALTVGGIIVGIPLALIGYFFAYKAVDRYQEDIRRKLAEQKVKHAIKVERRKYKKRRKKKAKSGASKS